MASQTDVANLALGRLRVSKFIADLTEQSTAAGICSRFMDQCRQEALRAFPWNFASRSVALAEVAGETFPGWQYIYGYPDDGINVTVVADAGGIRNAQQLSFANSWSTFSTFSRKNPFLVALKSDGASRIILSDMPSAYAFYTVDVSAVGVMPPDFISTWAWRLAAEAGGPLQADDARIQLAWQMYARSLTEASANSMNESKDDERPESPSIQCRS